MMVTLTTDAGLTPDGLYTITVDSVRDGSQARNPIPSGAQAQFVFVPGVTVGGLTVSSGRPYVWKTLALGETAWIDRPDVFTSVPDKYLGLKYLSTANNDKADFIFSVTFTVDQPATIYTVWDDSMEYLPAYWVDSNTKAAEKIFIENHPYRIYHEDFPAGEISLGTATIYETGSMYLVIAGLQEPTGTAAPDRTPVENYLRVFPNPFNPAVNISFGVTARQLVVLDIYTSRGTLTARLLDRPLAPGT
jgi:hypothetical protein